MMHPVTFIALTLALELRSGSTNNLRTAPAAEAPSSFVEKGSPDSFADLDAKLKQLEEKTKAELAKLQADTAAPSSFVEEGSPDSFADLDAKLKQLEEKTKAELAKLQADTAAPSSFLQRREGEQQGEHADALRHFRDLVNAQFAPLRRKLAMDRQQAASFAQVDAKVERIPQHISWAELASEQKTEMERMKKFREKEEEEIRRLQDPSPFAVENALRVETGDTSGLGSGTFMAPAPSSFLEDGDVSTPKAMVSLNRDQTLGAVQRRQQQAADAGTAALEHLSDNFVEKQDRSLAQLDTKHQVSDEALQALAARAEAAKEAAANEQRQIAPVSFLQVSEAHSPSWLATEHEMANEEREMKEFTKRNLQQIKELKDGHHSVRSVIQSTYNPVDLLEAAQRATARNAANRYRNGGYNMGGFSLGSSFLEERKNDPMGAAVDKLQNVEAEMRNFNSAGAAKKPRLELSKAERKADALTKELREEAEQCPATHL